MLDFDPLQGFRPVRIAGLVLPQVSVMTSKTAYRNLHPDAQVGLFKTLSRVLAVLRAQSMSYQTSHWQVSGPNFYGDHLLFDRLYGSVTVQIDQLAEKLVGFLGSQSVSLAPQLELIQGLCDHWGTISNHAERGLLSESELQASIKAAHDFITETGAGTLGLDDWLMSTANAHEENSYLLQQTIARVAAAAKGKEAVAAPAPVAPSAEDLFFDNPERREVREFSEAKALTNDPEVAAPAGAQDGIDTSPAQAVSDANAAPPTVSEILESQDDEGLSTLIRYKTSEGPLTLETWAAELSEE